jgi:hypothetical protein
MCDPKRPFFGVWVEREGEVGWTYGGGKIFVTDNYDIACAQLHCMTGMGFTGKLSVKRIGRGGQPFDTTPEDRGEVVRLSGSFAPHDLFVPAPEGQDKGVFFDE